MLNKAFARLSREEIFRRSGGQFIQINTLYQLLSMVIHESPLLKVAETFLDDTGPVQLLVDGT